MAIRKGYVDTADGQMHYRINEGGSGDPIVLVHMTSSSGMSYEPLMEALGGHRTTVAFDTPNYGASYRTDIEPTMHYIASSWLDALQGLGIERFHALGHHTGASIVTEMAMQAPERVLSATLSGLVYATPEQASAFVDQLVIDNPMSHYGTQFTWAWGRTMITMDGAGLPLSYKHNETLGTLVAGEKWHWAYRAVFAYDHPTNVHKITCPMFLVTGDLDRIAVVLHRQAADNLPQARVLTPENRGIDYMETYADEFAPHLLDFVKTADSSASTVGAGRS